MKTIGVIGIKTARVIVIVILYCLGLQTAAFGACVGELAVWGTSDDRESCKYKKNLKKKEQSLNIERRRLELENEMRNLREPQKTHNSATDNTVVRRTLDVVQTALAGNEEEKKQPFKLTRLDLGVSSMFFWNPAAYQGEMGMVDGGFMPNMIEIKYWVNNQLSIVADFGRWSFKGNNDFDAITTTKSLPNADNTGDELKTVGIAFPGDVEKMTMTSYHVGLSLTNDINLVWKTRLIAAIGQANLAVEYGKIDTKKYNTSQPQDFTASQTSIKAGACLERWTDGLRYNTCAMYYLSQLKTDNYTKHFPAGGWGFLVGVTIPLSFTGYRE